MECKYVDSLSNTDRLVSQSTACFFWVFLNKHLVTRCCNCLKPDYNLHVWTLSCILLYDYLLLLRSTSMSVYTWFFAMFLSRYMGEVYNPPTDKTEVKSLLKRRLSPNSTFVLAYFLLLIYVCCPILEILVVKKKSLSSLKEKQTNTVCCPGKTQTHGSVHWI